VEIVYKSGSPSALWKPELQRVYALFGEEDRLKEEAVAALIKYVVSPDFADFDLESLDAGTAGADGILSASGQVPFGSDRRLVIVKGMEQWRERAKSGEAERLAEGIARLSESACLVLVAAAEDEEERRKTAITTKLDNAIKKAGALVACRGLKGGSLLAWVGERVKREGKRIDANAAEQLVSTAGGEMLILEQEITKLVCYVGERETVTTRDVATVVASSPEDVMFTAVDAITRRQTDRALLLLAELHRYDPKPQAVAGKLMALLARQYRMLWQAKFLSEKRINPRDVRSLPPELSGELPGDGNIAQLAFKAADLFASSKNYSWTELTGALEKLLLCDLANKGGATDEIGTFGADPARNLQLLVLELTGATAPRQ
jgi:DNA polymerase-3 subunit delta